MSARRTLAGRDEACVPVVPTHAPRNTAVVIKTFLVMDAQCSEPVTRALAGSRDHPPPSAQTTLLLIGARTNFNACVRGFQSA